MIVQGIEFKQYLPTESGLYFCLDQYEVNQPKEVYYANPRLVALRYIKPSTWVQYSKKLHPDGSVPRGWHCLSERTQWWFSDRVQQILT